MRNMSICSVEITPSPTGRQEPCFRVYQWLSVDLGQGTLAEAVASLVGLSCARVIDWAFADTVVIESQLGGSLGNPNMRALSHAIQATASVQRGSAVSVWFLNASQKFSTWTDVPLPHSRKAISLAPRSRSGLLTKENAIALAAHLLTRNEHPDGVKFERDFHDVNIPKHKRKDLSDSLGLALTLWRHELNRRTSGHHHRASASMSSVAPRSRKRRLALA